MNDRRKGRTNYSKYTLSEFPKLKRKQVYCIAIAGIAVYFWAVAHQAQCRLMCMRKFIYNLE